MPASNSSLPALTLLPNLYPAVSGSIHTSEREINRTMLLDIAPDREALLMGGKSIDEIRNLLKIRTNFGSASPNSHWLYRSQCRNNVKTHDPTARISRLIGSRPDATTSNENIQLSNAQPHAHVIRRVLSTSAIAPSVMNSIDNVLHPGSSDIELQIWGDLALSTSEKLISPRPLGPTHIIVAYAAAPAPSPSATNAVPSSSPLRSTRRRPRPMNWSATYLRTVEFPINDLLFALNVPNLASTSISPFPHRLPYELPRLLMCVPHLATLKEAVVYLHTKNQAELFRALIPEWVRDIMHPLPVHKARSANPAPLDASEASAEGVKRRVYPMQLLGKLGAASTSSFESLSLSFNPSSRRPSLCSIGPITADQEPERTVDSIAQELADAASCEVALETPRFNEASVDADLGNVSCNIDDPLLRTASHLDNLRDNIEYFGFFGRSLWAELDVSRDILVRAIAFRARL